MPSTTLGELIRLRPEIAATRIDLTAQVGQRVEATHALAKSSGLPIGVPLEICEVNRDGKFIRVRDTGGRVLGHWHDSEEFLPARAANPDAPKVVEQDHCVSLNTILAARAFEQRVQGHRAAGHDAVAALNLAQKEDASGARAHRCIGISTDEEAEPQSSAVISLSVRPGESFTALCERTAAEQKVPLTEAIRLVSEASPDLARKYAAGEVA